MYKGYIYLIQGSYATYELPQSLQLRVRPGEQRLRIISLGLFLFELTLEQTQLLLQQLELIGEHGPFLLLLVGHLLKLANR